MKKLVGFCRTLVFPILSESDFHVNLSDRIWRLEKHSPLISASSRHTGSKDNSSWILLFYTCFTVPLIKLFCCFEFVILS